MSLLLIELVAFVIGLLFGSFLNVCIMRIPRGESIVWPGSRCPACRHAIRWFDNVPLLSWIVLRGRCRDCSAPISWRYPAVEFAMGLWFLAAGSRLWHAFHQPLSAPAFSLPFQAIASIGLVVLGFLLLGLIVMDWQTQRLPNSFTLSGLAAGMFLVCTQAIFLGPTDYQIVFASKHLRLSSPGSFAAKGNVFLTGTEALIFGRMAAVVGVALILFLIRWSYKAMRGREGLGLGDVKMLAMIAAFLGFWPALLTLFAGVLLATGYATALIIRRQANALTRLPLGSFLGVGGLFVALFGDRILTWYAGLLR